MARVHAVTGQQITPLSDGWDLCASDARVPQELKGPWLPAKVPGTVAQALRDAGQWSAENPTALHGRDFWFRTRFVAEGPRVLRFHGLATIAEVWLNGEKVLSSDSMFLAHDVPVTGVGNNELMICFRALEPVLKGKKGRARWRPRMIEPGPLRFVRTTLLGHMAGWCPPIHAVGPWRGVEVVQAGPVRVLRADVRSNLEGADGVLALELEASGASGHAWVEVAGVRAPLKGGPVYRGDVRVPDVAPWWPHTHGKPALHGLRAGIGAVEIDLGRVGFRSIETDEDAKAFGLKVNGQRVFCRGACWSSADLVGLSGARATYEPWLRRMRDAGMNMVRVGGTMAYESDAFFALCDELGILVWQDFMFANFDYPMADAGFVANVRAEAAQLLDRTQTSPALAVLCGGSEVEQQAAMLGLPKAQWSSPLFEDLLPAEVNRARPDVPYVTNSPSGGELPFSADTQVTHYYGVGAYLRPLEDARRADVKFASECLAFANVPEAATVAKVLANGEMPGNHPKWKARVPRDVGATWDFEDVREHYLQRLYGVDPARLRYEDVDRWMRMSRAVTGEVMEETFAEWRRARSTCGGALVWLYQDLAPGAGWGVVDALGAPKAAWHALRRAFRPVQLTLTDEGVNGLTAHLVNETPKAVSAKLSVACLRNGEVAIVSGEKTVVLGARSAAELPVAALFESFFDTTYAYRFGPAPHDVTVASLVDTATGERLADAFHFPQGRGHARVDLGLTAVCEARDGGWVVKVATKRFAQSVHFEDEAFRAEDDWFHLPPGVEKVVRLIGTGKPDGELHALNGLQVVRVRGS